MKDNFAPEDVVPEAILAPPDAPLPLARLQSCQFLDRMPPGAAVRIFRENTYQVLKSIQQLVKGYFEGSPAKLVSQFVNDNKLSLQELEELLQQIKSAKNQQL